eukprot:jgi/Botrbrau1/12672/Bobra.67_1s0036.1
MLTRRIPVLYRYSEKEACADDAALKSQMVNIQNSPPGPDPGGGSRVAIQEREKAGESAPAIVPPKLSFWERLKREYRGGDVRARHLSQATDTSEETLDRSSHEEGLDDSAAGAGSRTPGYHRRTTSATSVSSLVSDTEDGSFVEDLRSPGTANNCGVAFRYSLTTVYSNTSQLEAVDPGVREELKKSNSQQLSALHEVTSPRRPPSANRSRAFSPDRGPPSRATSPLPAGAPTSTMQNSLSLALSGLSRGFSGEELSPLSSVSDLAIPPLNIVMLVTGTRGDVQPFIALGLGLKAAGHRVRLATHAPYRGFVEGFGLEFYPLGGDPKLLSEYVVKNRGIFTNNLYEVKTQRKQLRAIINSTFPACTQPDPEHPDVPFTAEAIIANPVCYGHTACAEKLKVPIHMYFTMPWTPTIAFPHPMARIMYDTQIADRIVNLSKQCMYFASNAEGYAAITQNGELPEHAGWGQKLAHWMFGFQRNGQEWIIRQMELANRLSYAAIDDLLFPGMADIVDNFRTKHLQLPSLYTQHQYVHSLYGHNVPFSYCWSEALVARPPDWGPEIDVVGFFFLDVAARTDYEPPQDLLDFLAAEEPPVYIGFGSLVVDHPHRLTKKIYKALEETGMRGIISKGWGNLGSIPGVPVPPNIFLVDNVPHDWLFPRCSAVVHHGGAGTTAAGLLAGCPTTIVPFFGDQPFWGEAVRRAGAGPRPIPIDSFKRKKLVAALHFMQNEEVRERARHISHLMAQEDGVANGVDSFHRHLPLDYLLEKRRKRWSSGNYGSGKALGEPGSPLLSPENAQLALPQAWGARTWVSREAWRTWWQSRRKERGPEGGPGPPPDAKAQARSLSPSAVKSQSPGRGSTRCYRPAKRAETPQGAPFGGSPSARTATSRRHERMTAQSGRARALRGSSGTPCVAGRPPRKPARSPGPSRAPARTPMLPGMTWRRWRDARRRPAPKRRSGTARPP